VRVALRPFSAFFFRVRRALLGGRVELQAPQDVPAGPRRPSTGRRQGLSGPIRTSPAWTCRR